MLLDRAVTTAACLVVAYVCIPAAPASAQTLSSGSAAETCLAANRDLSLGASLPHTAARFREGGPQDRRDRIVVDHRPVGAQLRRDLSEVMRRELEKLRPSSRIEIVNSGRIGETIKDNLARFERDVLAHRPDLVIWQIGTNDVAWGGHADGLKDQVIRGVRALKTAGVDVILMDLQYAPIVLASSQHAVMQAVIAETARQERVALFPRFALMRRSVEAGLPRRALIAFDGLHNSRAGYDCIGRALARAVNAGAR